MRRYDVSNAKEADELKAKWNCQSNEKKKRAMNILEIYSAREILIIKRRMKRQNSQNSILNQRKIKFVIDIGLIKNYKPDKNEETLDAISQSMFRWSTANGIVNFFEFPHQINSSRYWKKKKNCLFFVSRFNRRNNSVSAFTPFFPSSCQEPDIIRSTHWNIVFRGVIREIRSKKFKRISLKRDSTCDRFSSKIKMKVTNICKKKD